jgi:hypothetical protein
MDREQAFDCREDGIEHFRLERAHDIEVAPLGRWWVDKHPKSLGATTTTGGWSGAFSRKYLTRSRLGANPHGLL